ncbi:MAG: Rrf2 family transcriptional regulator [Flavobacteriales bacterium]|nr:Rrf2 family transcriptional regulator [Flavobacteriales bacterium]
MFSNACEYAIRASVCIAACGVEGKSMRLGEIAKKTDLPEAFTAKVLQQLVHANLVTSTKGPGGGFSITPALARKVNLSHIVATIDGDDVYKGCALGLPQCDARKPCPLHDHFLQIREQLRRMLESTSVQDLVDDLKEGGAVLKR